MIKGIFTVVIRSDGFNQQAVLACHSKDILA
jgi:hypothetical protein